jgi:tetratricopeptide repeat protein
VAPIVFARCAPCHRPGGAGPFALLSYEDAQRRAQQIARVTARRYMPPWKAIGGVAFANQRRLGDREIATLRRWADAGAPLGDGAAMPKPPSFAHGWQLGTPDVVVEMAPYALAAGGADVYRNFVLHPPAAARGWIAAWELEPGTRAIHHAILDVDRNHLAARRDGEDGAPGYPGMEPGDVQAPDGFYLVWTPGQAPTPPAPGQAWRIDGDTDLVLQLHLQPTGKSEIVRPRLALYFAAAPPTQPRLTFRIGDQPIDIAPGARFTMRDQATLPVAVELLALFPHLHYLGRSVRVWAALPDGARRLLLAIDDWDPAWQEKYVLATPLPLPAGTTLALELGYDNSADNPRNPNRPPARVHTGERTVDEMGNVTFELRLAAERDGVQLRELKYRREVERGGGARAHYNLGNVLAAQSRMADAIAEYRRAVALQPSLLPARANLGRALFVVGDVDGAIAEYEAALKIDPANARVQAQLAEARRAKAR